jgi:4-diphosphocytidyl-2-C-methyl-D-erythritol kinase
MPTTVRSFAKINLGLMIGPLRPDGFHELRTLYQTVGLHDLVRVDVNSGTGIEVRSKHARVPTDESNTCYRIAERVMKALRGRGRVVINIEKSLPVQGGLGGASSNAVAVLLALERVLKTQLAPEERLRIAAEVGSDLPLFLLGGTVLGIGRGEEVYPAADLPPLDCVIVTPELGVSTLQAFSDWDERFGSAAAMGASAKLTAGRPSDTINAFSCSVFAWLSRSTSGVSAKVGGNRAEALLLDLVRAGIENDFERVVFPQHPELRDLKRALEREGAAYASLSGSGAAVYGLFSSAQAAKKAAATLEKSGVSAHATRTLTRVEYWKKFLVSA